MQPVIESLSIAEKRSLLASLLGQERVPLQLSLTQERIWQLCQLQPGTALYNFQTCLELQGELSPKTLEIAAGRIVLRHQILQTSYGVEQGKPALAIVAPRQIAIPFHDLSSAHQDEQTRRLAEIGMEDAQRGFDLEKPPLFRLTVVRLAPLKHRLFLTMHHIVSDFLSLDLFLLELGAFYSSEITGLPCHLPTPANGYQDFARMQRSPAARSHDEAHLAFWRQKLADPSPIQWFSDHVRPAKPTGKAGTEFFTLPGSLMQRLETLARSQQVTPFMALMAGFNILLRACTGQDDLIVGSPMAGRLHSDHERLIGMFSFPVLMRTRLAATEDFRALLRKVRTIALESTEHADVPFAKIADCSGTQSASLLRVMFSYVSRLSNLDFEGMTCRRHATNRALTDLDLFMTVYPDGSEWHGVLEYSADLFEKPTIRNMISAYIEILQGAIDDPCLSVADLSARVPVKAPARLVMAATFTADPLAEVLRFWSRELDLQFAPVFVPYNQMVQQLMSPHSPFLSPGNALNVLMVRPEDWIRCAGPDTEKQTELLRSSTRDFIAAVQSMVTQTSCPLKIYLCPPSPGLAALTMTLINTAEHDILEAFAGADNIEVLDGLSLAEMYSAAEIHDPQTDRTANIPYRPGFYAALGTQVIRQLRTSLCRPYKVLVLDCDNTLWRGLCAEDGAQGVTITENHRALQEWARQQAASGVLVCLASKNVPEHALAVFRQNPGMLLKETDITAYRINWEPKSSNLEFLAQELQLGLDSFVFIDDDARECAEVAARCPQVLCLRLPENPDQIPRFVRSLWCFDREKTSDEDIKRAGFYRDNKRRELARQQSASLEEFLATLELKVDVKPASTEQIMRIAQLTQRTNQFNSSGITFTSSELEHARQNGLSVMAVEVSDRFGDYGLVGAAMCRYDYDQASLKIEAFYLSCRVLGRGVEHRLLSKIGLLAEESNLKHVRIQYKESSRNQPFGHFLGQLTGQMEKLVSGSGVFVIATQDAIQSRLVPEDVPAKTTREAATAPHSQAVTSRNLAALARIPHELSTMAQILAQIDLSVSTRRELRIDRALVAPRDGLEKTIAAEWTRILRLDKVSRNDNFFELGGNSLLIVQLNGALINALGRNITIAEMFQYPTVASLAAHLTSQTTPEPAVQIGMRGSIARTVMQERKRRHAIQGFHNQASQAPDS